ncbi:MAG: DJ-1/PfpI family protein [Proteobacteria bacterium]|nr:DJ-1/PfpI family protein [Pseudomonadota bacterium]
MIKTKGIYFLIYDGFEMLDLSGPSAVFSSANQLASRQFYKFETISINGGLIKSNTGISIDSSSFDQVKFNNKDTLMVIGAMQKPVLKAAKSYEHQKFIKKSEADLERIASICSGVFLLASAGILDKKSVTTHWQACDPLSKKYPSITVKADSLYVVDGKLWTSAGVTTGIDMALAMVESDHGKKLMGQVAKQLIVYTHRPGYQTQFSTLLKAQIKTTNEFSNLVAWIEGNVDKTIRINHMAERVCMSDRTFYRKFHRCYGVTPAKFVEVLRLERGREFLEAGMQVKQVIAKIGFKSEAGFRSAFASYFGIVPSLHKKLNAI